MQFVDPEIVLLGAIQTLRRRAAILASNARAHMTWGIGCEPFAQKEQEVSGMQAQTADTAEELLKQTLRTKRRILDPQLTNESDAVLDRILGMDNRNPLMIRALFHQP